LSGITVDISGALKKNEMLKHIPEATRIQLTDWGATTVEDLKRSGRESLKVRSGALWKSPGMQLLTQKNSWKLLIGTGVGTSRGSQTASKYAMIQDVGGTTHPRVTPKMRAWAWFMHSTGFAGEIRGLGLRGAARAGAKATWGATSVYKAIALTKKSTLTVKIPASHWFTRIWERRAPLLKSHYLNDKEILRVAEALSGGTNAK
jgi:hypothetical protein